MLPRNTCTHSPCHTSSLRGDRHTQCPQQLDAYANAEAAESKAATAKDEETAMENAIKVSFSK